MKERNQLKKNTILNYTYILCLYNVYSYRLDVFKAASLHTAALCSK